MKDSVEMMDAKLRALFFYEAFLYYNPLFMIAFMLWLWGINVYGFSHSRVSYPKIFDLDHNHLTHDEVWRIAAGLTVTVLTSMAAYIYLYAHGAVNLAASQPIAAGLTVTVLTSMAAYIYLYAHGAVNLAASQPVILYCVLPLVMALPFEVLYANSRYYFLNTLFRLTFPLQPITFADFFVADVLTSMAKVLSDVERSVCRMTRGQVATIAWMEADDVCGSHSIMIPLVLSYPYVCRFFQCLRQYSDTRDKACLLNGALPFSRALAFQGVCNSRTPLLRNNLYYSRKWVYYWAICSNLALRVSWTYKLSSHLRHNFATVFFVAGLEMLRRFQWIFFRVENEWNKVTMRAIASENNLRDLVAEQEGKPLLPGAKD
eukprot:jgi/Mesen1/4751/ME000242S03926